MAAHKDKCLQQSDWSSEGVCVLLCERVCVCVCVCVRAAHLTGNEDKQPALRSYSPLFRHLSEKNRRTAFDRSRCNIFGFK